MVYMSILVFRHCVAFRNTLTLVSVHECNVKMTRQEDEKKGFALILNHINHYQ